MFETLNVVKRAVTIWLPGNCQLGEIKKETAEAKQKKKKLIFLSCWKAGRTKRLNKLMIPFNEEAVNCK